MYLYPFHIRINAAFLLFLFTLENPSLMLSSSGILLEILTKLFSLFFSVFNTITIVHVVNLTIGWHESIVSHTSYFSNGYEFLPLFFTLFYGYSIIARLMHVNWRLTSVLWISQMTLKYLCVDQYCRKNEEFSLVLTNCDQLVYANWCDIQLWFGGVRATNWLHSKE